jgi:hypothetical protein
VVQKVIDFWRVVEMLSPPAIPRVRPEGWVFDLAPDEPLPWNPGHSLRSQRLEKTQTWRHVVYVGTYQLESVFVALSSVFPPAAGSYEERPSGDSALLAFAVTDDGFMLEDSVVLSACAWATARTRDPGPASADWLDGFADLEGAFAIQLEEMLLANEEEGREAVVLDWNVLSDCRDAARDALGAADVLPGDGIRVRSEKITRRTADAGEHDFLNSFIADDLARVADAAGRGEIGAALRDYMRPNAKLDVGARQDVRVALDEVRRATDPDRVPLGRWPASSEQALALGQQLAVDEAVAMPRDGGHLFAVNGPPGTGKTTMLRDLIAALVTERAERLAALPDPLDAFTGEPEHWETTHYGHTIHRLRPELTGFELVVASSNNGAVENVTLELPSSGGIDDSWKQQAKGIDYFPTLAERAMSTGSGTRGGDKGTAGEAAWALIAARLGNRKNRRDFVNAVWWPPEGRSDDDPPPPPGLRDLLKGWEEFPQGVSWEEAVAAFGRARDRVAAIRDDRLRVRAALDRIAELEPELEQVREDERIARERVEALRPRRDSKVSALQAQEEERRRSIEAREYERQHRPGILRFRARAQWQARDRQLAAEIAALDARLHETGDELRELEEEVQVHAEAAASVTSVELALEECSRVRSRYRDQRGALLPDGEWLRERSARELRAPWTDAEWNQARTDLFLAALDLHRSFLIHAARPMRETLDGAMDIVAGKAPPNLSGDVALAAWQALFLVVPVISTTFASVSRMFKSLGPEALGWLLVDEAGQAAPQNAVGALWRCRHAVVVGDPLQLEPITTIPFEAEQAIREHYGVGEEWLTGRESVQSLADRLNRLGTTLPGAKRSVWVGAPLTVHRRCDEPMFGLSNAIAYRGLMLRATDPALEQEFATRYPTLPESKWIDVHSEVSRGHWISAEGGEVDRILAHLAEIKFDLSKVMAIGPFRDVARQLEERKHARKFRGLSAGTIHTAQGKEADVVILVLGSEPDRDGARAWAASKPNLLNVAVSRAKRRLYVIGDRNAWMSHRYFKVLAECLPHDRPRT